MTEPDSGGDLWSDPRPARQRGIWDEWEALLRARRDGKLADADYRRATATLRARLDQLGHVPASSGARPDPSPPPPSAPAAAPPAAAPPAARPTPGTLANRYGPMLTFLALVLILSVAAGYTITRLAN